MILSGPARAAALALALAAGLGGCVTIFPKAQPEQLYRFGEATPPSAAASAGAVTVRAAGLEFDRAAASDQILTVRGDEVSYVGGGRWEVPAQVLFEAAVENGFGAGGPVRYLPRGAPGHAQYALRLDVMRFEARYEGASAAPTIVVRLAATLTRQSDATPVGERVFEARAPAAANRIGAMVDAFDQATAKVVAGLTDWVDQTATPVAS
jgi:cholesterol transport system auxiliary component